MEVFDSSFFVGGEFLHVDTTTFVGYITRYDPATIDDTTGIGVVPLDKTSEAVSVYPNPFTETINIKSDFQKGDAITVIDVLGRKVYEEKITHDSNTVTFHLPNLNSGIYLCLLRTKNGVIKVAKVVKE